MRKLFLNKFTILAFSTVILLSACSDNKPSGDPPELPDFTLVMPSFDYFDQGTPKTSALPEQNFFTASSLALSMEFLMTSFSSLPEAYLSLVEEEDPEFNSGVWVWESAQSQGSESFSVRLEAEQTNSRVNWAMFISINGQEINYENVKLLDGFVLTDTNEGEWSIYNLDENSSSQSILTFDWIIESEDVASFNFSFDNAENTFFSFDKDTPDNTLSVNSDSEVVTIYWNSTTGAGYYDVTGGETLCWDDNGDDTTCI